MPTLVNAFPVVLLIEFHVLSFVPYSLSRTVSLPQFGDWRQAVAAERPEIYCLVYWIIQELGVGLWLCRDLERPVLPRVGWAKLSIPAMTVPSCTMQIDCVVAQVVLTLRGPLSQRSHRLIPPTAASHGKACPCFKSFLYKLWLFIVH
jgi:hypothetical protein